MQRTNTVKFLNSKVNIFTGRGVPSVIKDCTNNQLTPLSENNIPDEIEAKNVYKRTYSGSITEEINFGIDPLHNNGGLLNERETEFQQNYQVDQLYQEIVNNRPGRFKAAIMYYIDITSQLCARL